MNIPLPEYRLLLECYHPSRKLFEPSLHTTYLGTPGLEEIGENIANLPNDRLVGEIGRILNLYSHFKPHVTRAEQPSSSSRHPAGDIPGSRTWDLAQANGPSGPPSQDSPVWERVVQHLHLEGHELFTQLVSTVMMYRSDDRTGMFSELHVLEEDKTIRVWRDWLAKMAQGKENVDESTRSEPTFEVNEPSTSSASASASSVDPTNQIDDDGKDLDQKKDGVGKSTDSKATSQATSAASLNVTSETSSQVTSSTEKPSASIAGPQSDTRIVWTSPAQNFGIQLGVKKMDRPPARQGAMPILVHVDEEDVTYEIEYQSKSPIACDQK
jgi:hypothetical protein